jgi:hypothetical protein
MKTKKILGILCMTIALVLLMTSSGLAKAYIFTDNIVIPFEEVMPTAEFECPNGWGEEITFHGNMHRLIHLTENTNGGYIYTYHFQPMGAYAVGSDTGNLYHAVGITRGSETFNELPASIIEVNNFRMISPDSDVNFHSHWVIRGTFDEEGEFTMTFIKAYTTCR